MRKFGRLAVLLGFFSTGTLVFAQTGNPNNPPDSGRHARRSSTPTPAAGSPYDLLVTFRGTLRAIDKNKLNMEDSDGHLAQFYFAKKIAFYKDSQRVKWSGLKPGEPISIDGRRGIGGALEAVTVRVEPPPKPAQTPEASLHE